MILKHYLTDLLNKEAHSLHSVHMSLIRLASISRSLNEEDALPMLVWARVQLQHKHEALKERRESIESR